MMWNVLPNKAAFREDKAGDTRNQHPLCNQARAYVSGKIKGSENYYGETRVRWPQDRDRHRGGDGDICVPERGTRVALLERSVEPHA